MASSRSAIYGAMAANLAITATKFVVAGITGSSAMLAEGIHSAVDSCNSVLLLVGTKLSERPPSEEHPFGHGKELYFWSLIVAVMIFGIGGGVSFYEGVLHILSPAPMRDAMWNYIVIAAAAVFEAGSFVIALRQFRRQAAGRPFWHALHTSKDPSVYTVLAEDGAALLGLAVAAAGVYASQRFGQPLYDGAASIVIGLILGAVAVLLVRESRGLLVGEGIRASTAAAIREIAMAHGDVTRVGPLLSMYIGRDEVLLTMDLRFRDGVAYDTVTDTIARIERDVRERFPVIKRIYVSPVPAA
jgi:cation diffusion facilitator family transporter